MSLPKSLTIRQFTLISKLTARHYRRQFAISYVCKTDNETITNAWILMIWVETLVNKPDLVLKKVV